MSILKRRNWWVPVSNIDEAQFIWTQTRNIKVLKGLSKMTKKSIEYLLKLMLEVNPRERETPLDLYQFAQRSVK